MNQRFDQLAATEQWYAVQCIVAHEQATAHALESLLGVNVFLPAVAQQVRTGMRQLPFFPGYLFVQVRLLDVAPSQMQSIPGVVRLVSFGERPEPIEPQVIAFIRQQLASLHMRGGIPVYTFQPGDSVRFRRGPFAGLEATFNGPMDPRRRVEVLLEFLGSVRTLRVAPEQLEPVNPADDARTVRRTRGGGRVIRQH